MKIFDLEQEIMKCWNITDDIDLITSHFVDSAEWAGMDPKVCDALMNKYFGLKEVYDLKFQKLWDTFEEHAKEYHGNKKEVEKIRSDYGDDLVAGI
jgi:hypothetical protein